MSSRRSTPKTNLLRRLLEAYEASSSFGAPAPWARDVIVKFDEKVYPDAFSPSGAALHAAIQTAAEELAASGAIRVVYDRGIRRSQAMEFRLGPREVDAAYREAVAFGFVPLADRLSEIATAAAAHRSVPGLPDWMGAFLEEAAERVPLGDTNRLLGAARRRVKERASEIRDALKGAALLSAGMEGMERVVSERIFGHSKRLAEIKPWIRTIFVIADPHWRDQPDTSQDVVFTHYGIRTKPLFLQCAGGITYHAQSGTRSLLDDQPSASISEGLVGALAEGVAATGAITITTIENETPYHLYVEEAGGPEGLAERGELVVYSAGYPTSTLLEFLARCAKSSEVRFRHWGDADPDGVLIWWVLRRRVGRPVELYRTTAEWLRGASGRIARDLNEDELRKASGLCEIFAEFDEPDLAQAKALLFEIVQSGKRVEQERYYS